MLSRKSFTCYLKGEGTLLPQCAEILLARSIEIKGIISSASAVRQWARERHVPCLNSMAEMDWKTESIDYFFILGSEEKIPDEVLQKIFYLTINLHDGLLPTYAGANAPSWAILNNESWHGITWHVVDALINGGDILKQVAIPIAPDETADSLKIKCHELALRSFPELVTSLIELRYQPRQQNLAQRTCFAPDAKPPGNGCICWESSAEEIYRLWRATQFGNVSNAYSLAKIIVRDQLFVVRALHITARQSNEKPGTVMEAAEGRLIVCTGSQCLQIAMLSNVYGAEVNLKSFVERFNICPGYQLTSLSAENQQAMWRLSQQSFCHEKNWVRLLSEFRPTPVTLPSHDLSFRALPRSLYYQCLDFADNADELPLLLLAAWAIYLHRLENRNRIAIWLRLPCVDWLATQSVFFSAFIPITIEIDEQDNFSEIVSTLRAAYENLTEQKIFQHDIWQRYPELRKTSPPCQSAYMVDLTPVSHQRAGTGDPLPESFASLFTQLLLHSETSVVKINWLSLKEQQQILLEWNDTEKLFPDHKTIHRLFEEQAYKTPERIALIDGAVELSYGVLNAQVNQLSSFLKTHQGIKPDQLVAVYLESGYAMVLAMLGILKAGAVYLPLDPDDSAHKTNYILRQSRTDLIVSSQKLLARCGSDVDLDRRPDFNAVNLLALDRPDVMARLAGQPDSNPRISMTSSQLAYVRYTSVGEVVPHGIEIEHRGVVNQICWMNFAYPLCGSDRILQKASCASDIAVWELFWALGSGATAVLGCPDRTSGLDHFINLIHAKAVTVVQFTWAELNQLPASLLKTPGHLNGLEHIFCIGEMADIAAVNSIKNLLPKVEIHRLYGCSETAINVLSYDFTGLMDVCIGKPISNIRAYVLDQKLRPMPIGVKGQLYISGVGLARGSVRHWHTNETRFMANPFQDAHDKSRGCYERLYRTGDMARWLANGNLEFLGRETSQPKLDQSGSGLESV